MSGRFSRCPLHVGQRAVSHFVAKYWLNREGNVLLIGGAGFDPRSVELAGLLSRSLGERLHGLFLKEERPDAADELHTRAADNEAGLRRACSHVDVKSIDIFASDGAVIGGRRAAELARGVTLGAYADVVVDLSALSVGTAFPMVRTLLSMLQGDPRLDCRLHLMVSASPGTDEGIEHFYGDHVETIHGFGGGWGLDERAGAARAWLPQLRSWSGEGASPHS